MGKFLKFHIGFLFLILIGGCSEGDLSVFNSAICSYFGLCDYKYVAENGQVCVVTFPTGVLTDSNEIRNKIKNKYDLHQLNTEASIWVKNTLKNKYEQGKGTNISFDKFSEKFVLIDLANTNSKAPEKNCGIVAPLVAQRGIHYANCLQTWLNQVNREQICPNNSSLFGIGAMYVEFEGSNIGLFEPHLVLTEMGSSPELEKIDVLNMKNSTIKDTGQKIGQQLGEKIFELIDKSQKNKR